MSPKPFSIRSRIFTLAIAALALCSLGLVLFLQSYATQAADRAFDRVLTASALSIAGAVRAEDNQIAVELPYAALAMLPSQQRVFYNVRDAQGRLITGYDDLDRGMPLATTATPIFANRHYKGDEIRIGTVGRLVSLNQQAGWVTIRVAETREARVALAHEILQWGAAGLPVMAAMTLILLWLGIRHSFLPLRGLERELRQREPEDLSPVNSPVPREVKQLVEALNGFMQRLNTMLATLNGLVADAAHQVRTPLASLRAQAEVALDETDPQRLHDRVNRIHQNAARASVLVNQLLMDATIAHRLSTRGKRRVGLAEIINETRQRVDTQDAARLRIFIAPELRRTRLEGDHVALREMLRNLVDNALRHAPDSLVEIHAVSSAPRRLTLQVADRGPGIPDAEKPLVLERFGRGTNARATAGSGLGLSIAKAVAENHGGSLTLRNRPGGGLLACVILPLNPRPPKASHLPAMLIAPLAALALWGAPPPAQAQEPGQGAAATLTTRYAAPQVETAVLTLAGPTDKPVFDKLARGFQLAYPNVTLVYHELDSRLLYQAVVQEKLPDTDIVISSAVDLQLRLANDGHALHHESAATQRLPAWANWRSEVFGFTFEPIVMVYNTDHYTQETAPHSRTALIRMLEQDGARLRGRIGTYDIAISSLGHLLATQDERISTSFWGLANALGGAGVQLVSNTRAILDRIESGQLDLGYNVLGSYVLAYRKPGSKIGIVMPDDYQLYLSRAALILRQTPQPRLAGVFIDWLLSPAGQQVVEQGAHLGALPGLDRGGMPAQTPTTLQPLSSGIVQPIALTPTLLVGLDQQRHSRFLQNWRRLVTDTPAPPTTGR